MAKNRIDIPGERECDWQLLADLRAIDETVDLHYLGDGRWVLGSVRPNKLRYSEAGSLLRSASPRARWTRRLWELGMYGFARIALYEIRGWPDSRITADLRERVWRYQKSRDKAFEESLRHTSDEPERERAVRAAEDEAEARALDSYAWAFRGRKNFAMRGVN